jgi:hypothetical protein
VFEDRRPGTPAAPKDLTEGLEVQYSRSRPVPASPNPEPHFPVRLTQAQRKVVAEIIPLLADRLKPEEQNRQTIQFTLAELKAIRWLAKNEARHAETGMRRDTLWHVTDLTAQALDRSRDRGDAPGPGPADVDRP